MMDADRAAAGPDPARSTRARPWRRSPATRYAAADLAAETVIVADTGGTTYDVSLVRGGRIPRTRETLDRPAVSRPHDRLPLGRREQHRRRRRLHRLRSTRAACCPWARKSAGAVPGPACYGRGGSVPTVTDAALVLGYLDPAFFLGGALPLDVAAAEAALRTPCRPAARHRAGGGGACRAGAGDREHGAGDRRHHRQPGHRPARCRAGRRRWCRRPQHRPHRPPARLPEVVIPEVGAALSAAGALLSDLTAEHRATLLRQHRALRCGRGQRRARPPDQRGRGLHRRGRPRRPWRRRSPISREARYPDQVWEIEVPLGPAGSRGDADRLALEEDFHAAHQALFAVADPGSPIEIVSWQAQVRCRLREPGPARPRRTDRPGPRSRRAAGLFRRRPGMVERRSLDFAADAGGRRARQDHDHRTHRSPPSSSTRATSCRRTASGSLVIDPFAGD